MHDPISKLVNIRLQAMELSIIDLAELCGLHRNDIGRWLNGQRSIRLSKAVKVMQHLGIVVIHEEELRALKEAADRANRPPPREARRPSHDPLT